METKTVWVVLTSVAGEDITADCYSVRVDVDTCIKYSGAESKLTIIKVDNVQCWDQQDKAFVDDRDAPCSQEHLPLSKSTG